MSETDRARREAVARARGARVTALAGAALLAPLTAHAAEGLVLAPDLPILVGLIVFFVLLVIPLNRLLFQPVFRVLDERERRIAGTRARAAQLEREAQESFDRCEASIRSAREESEQARRALLETARAEALAVTGDARVQVEREIETARADIGRSLDSARAALRSQTRDLASEAASRVLGRAL
jgi:F-type H+-transporting ATPase subunit b